MHPDLEAVLALQERDKAVMAVENEIQALAPEFDALDRELQDAEAALDAARQRVDEADSRREELEGKIEGHRVMQERRRQRLEWVKGAKEASTLMAELDLARTVLAKEEAEWIRSADKVQEARHLAAEAETKVEELRTEQAPKREALEAKQAELDEKLQQARAARKEATAAVPGGLLRRYEKILKGRAPLALYPLQNGACGHCFTAIPLHRQQNLHGGSGVEPCEACGVLVYDPAEESEGGSDA